ncbi:MAG: PA14 domain-containing protein, partial [Gemmatimonadota bacterium]
DEWGPFDWRSPKLWPVDTARVTVPLRVVGPDGQWTVTRQRGIDDLSGKTGLIGDTLIITPRPGNEGDWSVEFEYLGEPVIGPRGTPSPEGEAVPFGFERFDPVTEWQLAYYAWSDEAYDPGSDPTALDELIASGPLLRATEPDLDFMWYRPLVDGLPRERWALEATASVSLPPGEFSVRTISDDGIRVWIDGQLVIDRFDPHGSEVDYAPVQPGEHDIRVRYYQLGGWSELRVEVVRGSARSRGSAGPH